MLADREIERLRSTVSASAFEEQVKLEPNRVFFFLRLAVALVCTAAATTVVVGELTTPNQDVSVSVFEPTTSERDEVEPTPSSVLPQDPFRELRYLAAGVPEGFSLQTVTRLSDAAPIAAFARITQGGRLTALVLVEGTSPERAAGPGVQPLDRVSVGRSSAVVFPMGPELHYAVRWSHPQLGPVQASGVGLSSTELTDFLSIVDLNSQAAIEDLSGGAWQDLEGFRPAAAGPVWRATYVAETGEILVVSTAATPGAESMTIVGGPSCAPASSRGIDGLQCGTMLGWNDDDDVEVTIFAEPGTASRFAEVLRPVSPTDRRVLALETEPLAVLDFSDTPELLYLSPENSSWILSAGLSHVSTYPVPAISLLLVERDVPEVGAIIGAVAVSRLPVGSGESGETIDDDGTLRRVVGGSSPLLIEASSHTTEEIDLLASLISVDPILGLQFAGSEIAEVGLERTYEIVHYDPVPELAVEGPVYGAVYEKEDGSRIDLRVSLNPRYLPELAAAKTPPKPDLLVEVRGLTGTLILRDGVEVLTWQEAPGVVITLSRFRAGDQDSAALLEFAADLQLVTSDDVRLR